MLTTALNHNATQISAIIAYTTQASFERFLLLLRLLDLDNVDFNEGRVIDQKLTNATVADLTRLSRC